VGRGPPNRYLRSTEGEIRAMGIERPGGEGQRGRGAEKQISRGAAQLDVTR
jgi:hypothetical protein